MKIPPRSFCPRINLGTNSKCPLPCGLGWPSRERVRRVTARRDVSQRGGVLLTDDVVSRLGNCRRSSCTARIPPPSPSPPAGERRWENARPANVPRRSVVVGRRPVPTTNVVVLARTNERDRTRSSEIEQSSRRSWARFTPSGARSKGGCRATTRRAGRPHGGDVRRREAIARPSDPAAASSPTSRSCATSSAAYPPNTISWRWRARSIGWFSSMSLSDGSICSYSHSSRAMARRSPNRQVRPTRATRESAYTKVHIRKSVTCLRRRHEGRLMA